MSLSEIDTGVSAPEDELVRAELDEARRKRRTGRARIVGTAALPGLSYFARRASRVTLASTALSVIAPGGAAAGMATTGAMLRACGFSGRPVGLAIVVMSVWNQSVILGFPILGFPILAVAGLAAAGARNRTLEIAALVGLAVFAVIVAGFAIALSSERLAIRVGDRRASYHRGWAPPPTRPRSSGTARPSSTSAMSRSSSSAGAGSFSPPRGAGPHPLGSLTLRLRVRWWPNAANDGLVSTSSCGRTTPGSSSAVVGAASY